MKAVIIGGGIGGPVAAVALRRAGIDAVVYEAHDGPAESLGLFLGLGINGMRVLRELGMLDAVLAADWIPTPRMVFTSWTGRQLGEVSSGWLDASTPSITILRGTLQQALADAAAARGVRIRYGRRFTGCTATENGVIARFEDGGEAECDVLIGADGIRSRVRAVMSPDAPSPSYTGLLNLGGVVRDSGLAPTPDAMHMVWGRRAFFGYTVRPDGAAWWFANIGSAREPTARELAAVPAAEWQARLCALFADDPPFINELIGRAPEIGAYPIHDMPPLPSWSRGRVALLGDAVHAVSPSAGQGASLAMEDAVMLAKCLRDIRDPVRALARYEALRRPRAERIVVEGRRRGRYKAPESRLAVWLRDRMMPLALRVFATERAMSWIHDYRIPWDEPVTEAG